MSLLDNGPDLLAVYPEATVEDVDEYGNRLLVPDPTPVLVNGRWQPSTFDEAVALGQAQDTVFRFISREFPAGPYGRARFEDQDYDVIGQPKPHRGSSTTRHFTAYLKRR